jgi:hypothetical protein
MAVRVLRQSFLTILGLLLLSVAVLIKCQPQRVLQPARRLFFELLGMKPEVLIMIGWLFPIAVFAAFILFTRTGQRLVRLWTRSPLRLAASATACAAFFFSLFPAPEVGWATVAYLYLAGPGFVLVLAGAWPVLAQSLILLRPLTNWLLHRLRPKTFLLLVSGLVLVITNLISGFVFRHIPHVMDSTGQVFQGRIFASGRVWLPARFDDYFFSFFQVFNDGRRIFAVEPFGHSLLLALGTLVRAEWLINPLLGAAEIVVIFLLGREVYDERTGRIAALLGAASPFLLFMSSEYMNHASALFFLSLFLLFYFRTIRSERQGRGKPRTIDPLLSGLCLAMALNIRPLTALAVAAPVAIYSVFLIFKSRARLLKPLLLMALPVVLGIGALALYNHLTTGTVTLPGYNAYCILEQYHARFGVGFGYRDYTSNWGPHTPIRGVVQTINNLVALNRYLFEGPLPGLILVLLLFLSLPRNKADYLLLALFAALPIAYFFYFFQDLCFGPRFLYEGLAPLLLLSARGLIEFPRVVDQIGTWGKRSRTSDVALVALLLSFFITAAVGLPPLARVYASNYWGVNSRIQDTIRKDRIRNAVVFVNPRWPSFGGAYYGSGFLVNTLDFGGPVVCALDRGDENYLLMKRFPGRKYYYASLDTFFEIPVSDSFRGTPEFQALEQAGQFIREYGTSDYRCILLPFREISELIGTGTRQYMTFREAGYRLFVGSTSPKDFTPALAVFLSNFRRSYPPLFEPMRDGKDYTAGGCRFVLRFRSENGTCAVYEIQPTQAVQ